jgi:DNA-binding transcriptional MerR regulator
VSSTEEVYSARQTAERLGLSPAMTRRYAAALEEITGEAIKQHPRDGRQYSREQLETILRAKAFVEANTRLSISQALQMARGEAPAVATPAVTREVGATSQAFAEALERSLLPELRALREEVASLRREAQEARTALPPARQQGEAASGGEGGALVRFARWLEQRLRGGGGSG